MDIDPLSQYKTWRINQNYEIMKNMNGLYSRYNVDSDAVKGTFIVSDPVDWGRDIQVLVFMIPEKTYASSWLLALCIFITSVESTSVFIIIMSIAYLDAYIDLNQAVIYSVIYNNA